MSVSSIAILVIVIVLWLYVVGIDNKLVTLRNRFQSAFAQIEVQLKRRYDLIPNLVGTAKAYLKHERETLEAVVVARNTARASLQAAAVQPGNLQAMAHLGWAEVSLASAMGHLDVIMEACPDLQSSQIMAQLSEELTSTENLVAFSRQAFNEAVMAYNTYKQSFPLVLFASLIGHRADASLLIFSDSLEVEGAPQVAFN